MMKFLKDIDLEGKTVFLRVDWNVPLKSLKVLNDNRIRATLPTINYLISKKAKIIIGTHLGRPEGRVVSSLSTKILAERLSALIDVKIFSTDFVVESKVKNRLKKVSPGEMLILGNLRWHPEEEENNRIFAQILASYADAFINDAFSVSHRAHASVDAITEFLPSYAGLQLEKEVETLKILTREPRKPMVLILGGAKIKDKIGLIKSFKKDADKVLIGGAIANTFRYFRGDNVSESLYESGVKDTVDELTRLLKGKIILPQDEVRKNLSDGKFKILDIGDSTIKTFTQAIASAKTIFWNGNLGFTEEDEYQNGSLKIAQAVVDNPNIKIVAGGDTVGFLESKNLLSKFTFASTGGGAALEFLAGKELPGLKALGYYREK